MTPRSARRAIDLSHEIVDGMTTHPGIPPPAISAFLTHEASTARYAPGTTFEIGRIDLVANTGTYLDTPAHRFRGGADLAALALDSVVDLDGVVVDCRRQPAKAIGPEAFAGVDVEGRAVLVATGWDANWGTPAYLSDNPFLTEAAAKSLVERGAALIGIDSLNVDSLADPRRPAHTAIPACRHSPGGTSDGSRGTSGERLAILRSPAPHPRHGHLPGACVRVDRLRSAESLLRTNGCCPRTIGARALMSLSRLLGMVGMSRIRLPQQPDRPFATAPQSGVLVERNDR